MVSNMAIVSMLINEKIVETQMFPNAHLHIKGYLQGLQYDMLERNDEMIRVAAAKPAFKLEITRRKIVHN